jgi:hypothetical protein
MEYKEVKKEVPLLEGGQIVHGDSGAPHHFEIGSWNHTAEEFQVERDFLFQQSALILTEQEQEALFRTAEHQLSFWNSSTTGKSLGKQELTPAINAKLEHTNDSHSKLQMDKFDEDSITNFKQVLYNILVEQHNHPQNDPLIQQFQISDKHGNLKYGMAFNTNLFPEKALAELYSTHARRADLTKEDPSCIFIQDIYKFYYRACEQLLAKYFEKTEKYKWIYSSDLPLFVEGSTLEEADQRIKRIKKKRVNPRPRTL